MKFKVGDRVKRILGHNLPFEIGDTGEVVEIGSHRDISVKLDKNGQIKTDNWSCYLELIPNEKPEAVRRGPCYCGIFSRPQSELAGVSSKSELDQLLETAEAGRRAAKKLVEEFKSEIEYDKPERREVHAGDIWGIGSFNIGFRKASKSKFEPRKIGGLEVSLEGETLTVGCQKFPLVLLRTDLKNLLDGAAYRSSVYDSADSIFVIRNGVYCAGHTMLWADVEKLYEAIKELS